MEPQRRNWSLALGLGVAAQGVLVVPFLPLLVIGLVAAFRGHMDHGDWNVLKSGAIGTAVCLAVIIFNPYRSAFLATYGRMLRPASWTRRSKIIGVGVLALLAVIIAVSFYEQPISDRAQRKQIAKMNVALAIVEADTTATTAGAIALLRQHQEEIGLTPVSGAASDNRLSVAATAGQVVLMTSSRSECIAVVDNSQNVQAGIANAPAESGLWHIIYLPGTDNYCDASRLPTPKNGQVGLFHGASWSRGPLH
jgi:hypothetical protein